MFVEIKGKIGGILMKISREKGIGYERIRRCLWRL